MGQAPAAYLAVTKSELITGHLVGGSLVEAIGATASQHRIRLFLGDLLVFVA